MTALETALVTCLKKEEQRINNSVSDAKVNGRALEVYIFIQINNWFMNGDLHV